MLATKTMSLLRHLTYVNKSKCSLIWLQNKYVSCWSCEKDIKNLISNLFCSHCKTLQRPNAHENYFKLMGINESYDINDQELIKRYKDLQKSLHPDKYASRSKKELEISEEYSSLVNEAYKTLLQPLARGIYLLQLKGQDLPENTQLDQDFLVKIMSKNEEVEEAETDNDILKLNNENKAIISSLEKKLSKAFLNGELKEVIKYLSYMKYYTSIDNQIQNVIRSKGIIR